MFPIYSRYTRYNILATCELIFLYITAIHGVIFLLHVKLYSLRVISLLCPRPLLWTNTLGQELVWWFSGLTKLAVKPAWWGGHVKSLWWGHPGLYDVTMCTDWAWPRGDVRGRVTTQAALRGTTMQGRHLCNIKNCFQFKEC